MCKPLNTYLKKMLSHFLQMTKYEVMLRKLYPEELELNLYPEEMQYKIGDEYYHVGARKDALWPYLQQLFIYCFGCVVVGNIITFLIVKRGNRRAEHSNTT